MTSTTTRRLGDLVRANKDARPPDQSGWGSEAPPAVGAEPITEAQAAVSTGPATRTKKSAPAKRATKTAARAESAPPPPPAGDVADDLPAYLQLERVQTRVEPEVMTAIRTAEVRLKAARRPAAVAGERLNTNTVIRAALRAVVESGALENCTGTTEAELVASIQRQLRSSTN